MPLDGTLYEDEILRTLRAAQERIRLPENWGRRYLYKDGKVCARGAVMVAVGISTDDMFEGFASKLYKETTAYLNIAAVEVGFPNSAILNDNTDQPTTYTMFDRAQELRLADVMEAAVA